MTRFLIASAFIALSVNEASPQATLLGNCGAAITGFRVLGDQSIDIYCVPLPATACPAGGLDLSKGCNLQFYLRGTFP